MYPPAPIASSASLSGTDPMLSAHAYGSFSSYEEDAEVKDLCRRVWPARPPPLTGDSGVTRCTALLDCAAGEKEIAFAAFVSSAFPRVSF